MHYSVEIIITVHASAKKIRVDHGPGCTLVKRLISFAFVILKGTHAGNNTDREGTRNILRI